MHRNHQSEWLLDLHHCTFNLCLFPQSEPEIGLLLNCCVLLLDVSCENKGLGRPTTCSISGNLMTHISNQINDMQLPLKKTKIWHKESIKEKKLKRGE
jgi:hypothetical protein